MFAQITNLLKLRIGVIMMLTALVEEYHARLAGAYRDKKNIGDKARGKHAYFLAWHYLHSADPEEGVPFLQLAENRPGEAWLEFAVEENEHGPPELRQVATFRPRGLLGRIYWFAILPFHWLLFPRMARSLAGARP